MLADFLPLLLAIAAAFLVIICMAKATKKREAYCGKNPKNCFWCGEEHCEKYHLQLVD